MNLYGKFPRLLLAGGAIAAALLLAIPAGLAAQDVSLGESWRWVRFSVDDGLPSNRIQCLVEIADDSVWALTSAGLAHYDGLMWRRVAPQSDAPPRRVTQLVGDHRGGVWAIAGGRLFCGTERGIRLARPCQDGRLQGVSGMVAVSADTIVLSAVRDKQLQLWRYRPVTDQLSKLDLPAGVTSRVNVRLWSTDSASFFLRVLDGLYYWRDGNWQLVIPGNRYHLLVHGLAADSQGCVVLLVCGAGDTGIWEWQPGQAASLLRREGSPPIAVAIAPDDTRVFAYPSGDLRSWSRGRWSELFTVPDMTSRPQLLRFRRNGDLWVGSDFGLYLHKSSSRRWARLAEPGSDVRNHVLAILVAQDGAVWRGTPNGVFVRRRDGSTEWVDEIDGQRLSVVTGLCQDGRGDIWISSGSGFTGVYRFSGNRWHRVGDGGIGECYVHRIEVDRAGKAWFCTLRSQRGPGGSGPGPFVNDGGTVGLFPVDPSFDPARVYAFVETSDGARWFGTSQGVRRWHRGRWTQWGLECGLRQSIVFDLAIGPGGQVWFCHSAGGIGWVDRGDELHYVEGRAVESGVSLWDLEFSHDGDLWVTTSEGVVSLRGSVWTRYDRRSLLAGARTWPIVVAGEKVYFGTLGRGIVVLDTREAAVEPPLVRVEVPVVEADEVQIRWRPYASWGDLSPAEVDTRWQIDGGPWSPWSLSRSLRLDDLATGPHRVGLQAKGYFGGVRALSTEVGFDTPPPYYAQPQFYLPIGSLLVVLALASSLLLLRRHRHRAMQLALDRQLAKFEKMAAVGRLAGGIAHDFNNLLTSLLGNAEAMRDRLQARPDGKLEAHLGEIEQAVARAAEMTQQLQVIGQRKGGSARRVTPDLVLVQMQPMLRRLVPAAIDFGFTLRAPDCAVALERGQFERIVMNLVLNAAQSIRGGGSVRVETEVREFADSGDVSLPLRGECFSLLVRDTGCGFDAATARQIFDPFFTTKPIGEGTGLGLSTVQSLLQQAGGVIEAESQADRGSTFRLLLPAMESAGLAGAPAKTPQNPRDVHGSETILLCDDDVAVRVVMRHALEKHGYTVIEVEDGVEALQVVDGGVDNIDMIVSDVVMPRLSGRGLVAALSERSCRAKVLLVSGFEFDGIESGDSNEAGSGASLGGVALLQKPFSNHDLLRSVRATLD